MKKNFVYKNIIFLRFFVYISIIFYGLSSCTGVKIRTYPRKKGKQEILKPYIKEYKQIVKLNKQQKNRLKKLHINILPINDGSVVGRCWYYGSGQLEIVIDKHYWENWTTNEIDKQFLVFHELEHCIRYREHTNPKKEIRNIVDFFERIGYGIGFLNSKQNLPDGCPPSLMNSHTLGSDCKSRHYMLYIREMQKWPN